VKRRDKFLLFSILIILVLSLVTIFPLNSTRLGRQGLQLGLDLKGGTYLVYQADLSKKDPSQTDAQVMTSVVQKIERRANAFGVTEPIIQVQGTDRVLVQLPGVKDVNAAIKLIGQVALLEFKEQALDTKGQPLLDVSGNQVWLSSNGTGLDGQIKNLTGQYLKPNASMILSQTGQPEVAFQWNAEGANLFQQITTRMLNKRIGIFLDNVLISAPTVSAVITDSGVITGVSVTEGRNLAIELNSGSLDVPLTIIQQTDVDATLGADSLSTSLRAGLIGIALVVIFMIVYYRSLGVVAALALFVYGALSLAIFKLIPITLTLPGIAGFIISVGMAVDANILIFERMKEEMRTGHTLKAGVAEGFRRAWPSIRDSNISTFITCAILYWFGSTFGAFMVKGFALTLFLGVAVSMFSAITVTRVFLTWLVSNKTTKRTLNYLEARNG
jgi:preprotein translocase subunit SecD